MVKKKSFLDVISKPLVISTIVVYLLCLASSFIIGGIINFGPMAKLAIWQDIIFPIVAFATGLLIAKYRQQPKPEISGIIFVASAWLWTFLTWWGWGSLFEIFLWKWWHTGSSLAVQLISAYIIQLLITLFIFGKKFSAERIRVQLYTGLLTLAVLGVQAITYGNYVLHVLGFNDKDIVPYGGVMYVTILLFFTFGQTFVLALSLVINTIMLYKHGTKSQQFMINNLFAFYASLLAASLGVFITIRPLHETVNIWILAGVLVLTIGLDIWAMLYFRRHLSLRKG